MPPASKRWHRSWSGRLDEVCEGGNRGGGLSGDRWTLRQFEAPAPECGYDSLSRAAIAVGTVGVRHALVFSVVVQELHGGREDGFGTRADEARSSRRDRLRPFRRVAHNENRLPQRRGLLLNAPGIRNDQVRAAARRLAAKRRLLCCRLG